MTPEAILLAQWRGMKTLQEMYADLEAAGVDLGRDGGHDIVHGRTDARWKRRLRGALQTAKRKGHARRGKRDDGTTVWILVGTPEQPQKVLARAWLARAFADLEAVKRRHPGCWRYALVIGGSINRRVITPALPRTPYPRIPSGIDAEPLTIPLGLTT